MHRLAILDTKPEERFDWITKEAAAKFNAPMSMISILDKNREWYKSCQGSEATEQKRSISFCGHALVFHGVFLVEDTLKDARFADNPMVVKAPFIRFYAGVALYDYQTNMPIGVFCIKDTKPRQMNADEISSLINFAERAEKELNKSASAI